MVVLAVLTAFAVQAGAAAPPPPTADKAGTRDNPIIKRFEGSVIVSSDRKAFDEFVFPVSPLERVENKRDDMNNQFFEARQQKRVEGAYTRLVYLIPPDRSTLEVLRNYQQEVKTAGGSVLFECADLACGGDGSRASSGGGSRMSLSMVLRPARRIAEVQYSPGHCALLSDIADQRFAVMELPSGATLSVLIYVIKSPNRSFDCHVFNERVVAVVDIVEPKAREQKMVSVSSSEMAQSIAGSGRVALYGILFDSNKAEVKPESEPTLEQMGKLLKAAPEMKLLVVGHTDNVGGFAPNVDLSQRRAAAVVQALVARHGARRDSLTPVGVSYASPVTTNKTDDGRARNRRVELVEN